MQRREFLKSAAALGISATAPVLAQSRPNASPTPSAIQRPQSPDMIYRQLGTTGEIVSAIGLGGGHIGGQKEAAEGIRLTRAAIDRGITFMDNCWDYSDGLAEVRMGQALRDGNRQKVFLMTKMDGRTADAYNKQLEQSLGRLQTDMIDLVQFHERAPRFQCCGPKVIGREEFQKSGSSPERRECFRWSCYSGKHVESCRDSGRNYRAIAVGHSISWPPAARTFSTCSGR
jgi:hypothetical protein